MENKRKIKIKSRSRMSNTRYHQFNKPLWWAYYRDNKDKAVFLKIPRTRGDEILECEVEIPENVSIIYIGVGPKNNYGVRETIFLKTPDKPQPEQKEINEKTNDSRNDGDELPF